MADDDDEGAWNRAPRGEFDYVRVAVFDRVKAEELFLFVFVQNVLREYWGDTLQGEARKLFTVVLFIMATTMTFFVFAARALVVFQSFHYGGVS